MVVKMVYEVMRSDGSWAAPVSKSKAVLIAGTRLVAGHGWFTIFAPFRRPTSEQTVQMPRRRALDTIARLYGEMHDRDQMSVRDKHSKVILRVRATPAVDPRRSEMVRHARWGCAHEAAISYSQARPYHKYHPGTLPMSLDCSSSTIVYAMWSDAPDPSGNGFSGGGNTDAILANLRPLSSPAKAQLGDLILWHNGPDGKHVAVVVEPGRDPLLASHGSENGPLLIRYSVEYRYHAGETATALDLLS